MPRSTNSEPLNLLVTLRAPPLVAFLFRQVEQLVSSFASCQRRRFRRSPIAVPVAAVLAWSAGACSSKPEERLGGDDSGVKARVFAPPSSTVRAVPPHHIHAKGIGPYELGATTNKILSTLPHGPRLELFRLGALADFSLARAEDDALLIGIERDIGVTFVASVKEGIARTDGGVGVRSLLEKAQKEFGAARKRPDEVGDPRLVEFAELPGATFITNAAAETKTPRIVAVFTEDPSTILGRVATKATPRGKAAAKDAVPKTPCVPGAGLETAIAEAAQGSKTAVVQFSCVATPSSAEGVRRVTSAVVARGSRVVWLGLEDGKSRRLGTTSIAGLRFAAPIELATAPDSIDSPSPSSRAQENRRLLVAVSEQRTFSELRVSLEVFRADGGRMISVGQRRLYSLSADEVSWVGGTLPSVHIAISVRGETATSGESRVIARGLYLHFKGSEVAMVAPLAVRSLVLSLKRKQGTADSLAKPGVDGGQRNDDAGTGTRPDAGARENLDAGVPDAGPTPSRALPDKPSPRRGSN